MSSDRGSSQTHTLLHLHQTVSVTVDNMTSDLRLLRLWFLIVAVIVVLIAGYAEGHSQDSEQLQRDTETLQIAGQAKWPEKPISAPADRSYFSDPFAGDWGVWSLCEPGMR